MLGGLEGDFGPTEPGPDEGAESVFGGGRRRGQSGREVLREWEADGFAFAGVADAVPDTVFYAVGTGDEGGVEDLL